MTQLSDPYDYTDRDLAAIRVRLQALATAAFPTWTDFNRSGFDNFLLELMGWVGDLLGTYQDNQSGESRWTTAAKRRSIIALAKLISYELDGATAAQVTAAISIPAVLTEAVVVPAGTIVATLEETPAEFQLLAAATIAAGSTSVDANVENSESFDETFETDGSPSQQVKLGQTPFLEDSQSVVVGALAWTKVNNFLDSDGSDRHYQVIVDETDSAFLRFGDGVLGAMPLGTLEVGYKTGGGTAGNVEVAQIKEIRGSFYTVGGASVTLSVTNAATPTVLGTSRETKEVARIAAPGSLRGLNRTVARTDFEDNALLVIGVGRALCLSQNELAAIPENQSRVWLVPTGGGLPSLALRTAVELMYSTTRPKTITHTVQVMNPLVLANQYLAINVVATIYLSSSAVAATVYTAVNDALTAFFAPLDSDGVANANVDFGFNFKDESGAAEPGIRWSDVHNLVRDVTGIRKMGTPVDGEELTLNGAADDVTLNLWEFPSKGTLTLVDGDTGIPIPAP